MPSEQSERQTPLARVYDPSDGEHVANLHTEELVLQFKRDSTWRVEEVEV